MYLNNSPEVTVCTFDQYKNEDVFRMSSNRQPWLEIKFGVRCYVPKTLRQLGEFSKSVAQYWGALLTGGVLIALLQLWQGLGHTVWRYVNCGVALVMFFVATFLSWRKEYILREELELELALAKQHFLKKEITDLPVTKIE